MDSELRLTTLSSFQHSSSIISAPDFISEHKCHSNFGENEIHFAGVEEPEGGHWRMGRIQVGSESIANERNLNMYLYDYVQSSLSVNLRKQMVFFFHQHVEFLREAGGLSRCDRIAMQHFI